MITINPNYTKITHTQHARIFIYCDYGINVVGIYDGWEDGKTYTHTETLDLPTDDDWQAICGYHITQRDDLQLSKYGD